MSDDGNDDQWLYGDSINPEPPESTNEDESKDKLPEDQMDTVVQDEPMEVPGEEVSLPEGLEPPTIAPPTIAPPGIDDENPVENGADEIADPVEDGQIVDGAPGTEVGENGDDDDDDSDEDDVQVVIGDIKATTNYSSLNIKRGGLLTSTGTGDKMSKQPGKFSIEEFETVGTINGHEAIDFNLDTLEEKPWRKPGADITDYFNYGFNEETWRSYCERQKRIRIHESGVGLVQLGGPGSQSQRTGLIAVSISNDNSKYSTWEGGMASQKKAGPPPGRKYAGSIDVIGGGGLASRRGLDKGTPPKENVIQVMTADRRDYGRPKPGGFPDMSMPPPPSGMPPPFDLPPPAHSIIPRIGPPSGHPPFVPHLDPYGNVIGPMGGPPMMMGGGPPGDFYPPPEVDPYYQSYEPTQDCQWNDPVRKNWQPTSLATLTTDGVKVLTPGPVPSPLPPVIQAPSRSSRKTSQEPDTTNQDSQDGGGSTRDGEEGGGPVTALGVVIKEEPKDPEERRERRDRSEKHKERSHRHRSRSRSAERSTERRSRRHRSRSRSPGHRSHRKKKSRRSEREKSKEESE